MTDAAPIRFAAIGLDHAHIFGQTRGLLAAGAELVLSVNATNRDHAPDWGVEVVALPDRAGSLDGLEATAEFLEKTLLKGA